MSQSPTPKSAWKRMHPIGKFITVFAGITFASALSTLLLGIPLLQLALHLLVLACFASLLSLLSERGRLFWKHSALLTFSPESKQDDLRAAERSELQELKNREGGGSK